MWLSNTLMGENFLQYVIKQVDREKCAHESKEGEFFFFGRFNLLQTAVTSCLRNLSFF